MIILACNNNNIIIIKLYLVENGKADLLWVNKPLKGT